MAVTYHAGRRIQGLADDRLLTTEAVYTSVTGTSTYEKLSGSAQTYSSEKAGVELVSTANDGKAIKIGKWKLAREGTLSGLAYMKVEDGSGNLKATSTGVDVSSITVRTSGYEYVTFTLPTAVKVYNGYRVYIEYTTADGSGNFLAFGEFYNGSTTIPTGFEFTVYNKRDSGGNNPSGGWTDDGLPTLIIPDAIFDDVPVTDENQITNVQVGSRFEETDTRKMYNYSERTKTVDENFDSTGLLTWTDSDSAKITVDSSTNERLDFTFVRDSTTDETHHDLGSALSNTAWVMDFDLTLSTVNQGGGTDGNLGYIGIFSATGQSAQDGMHLQTISRSDYTRFKATATYNTSMLNEAISEGTAFTTVTPSVTTYYVRIIRDGNDCTVEFYSSADRTGTPTESQTETQASITGLRYISVRNLNFSAGNSGNNNLVGYIDNLKVYDGVTDPSNYWQEIGA